MSVDETIYKARKKDRRRKYFRVAGLTTVASIVAVISTFMFGVNKKLNDNPKSVKNLAPHMIFLKYFIKWFSKKK
jgi:hypothetical protein